MPSNKVLVLMCNSKRPAAEVFASYIGSLEFLQSPVLTDAALYVPVSCKPYLADLRACNMPYYHCVRSYPEGRYTICSCRGAKLTSSKVLVPLVPP